jgi:hypothetical protein
MLASLASTAHAQSGYYYSGYPGFQASGYGYPSPGVSYSTYYGPGYTSSSYSSYYYATPPASIAPQFPAPAYNSYVVPQYYRAPRVVVPALVPVIRRPVVLPVPGFGFRRF